MKILIVSASIGEGHATAARALKARLERDARVTAKIVDCPEHMGRVIRHQVEAGYEKKIRERPKAYGLSYTLIMRFPPTRMLAQWLLSLFARRPFRRMVAAENPDAVVSVYPAATMLLGQMRRAGRLECPVYAAVIDIYGLHFWAHRGVDKHLVVHRESLAGVEKIAGRGCATLVNPMVAEQFFSVSCRDSARAELDLPGDRPIVVVSGGGWGVGDLAGAVEEALAARADAYIVAVAGRSAETHAALIERFGANDRVRVLGFCTQMPQLLRAANLLIHSTGGVTVVEARLAGCPSISYGLPVGHIIHNMRALNAAGHTDIAMDRDQLAARIQARLGGEAAAIKPWPHANDASAIVTSGETRVKPRWSSSGSAQWFAARAAMFLATLTIIFSSGDTYSLAAKVLPIQPADGVPGARSIALVVTAPPAARTRIERELRLTGAAASISVAESPTSSEMDAIRTSGDAPILLAGRYHGFGWIKTRGRLPKLREDGHPARSYYLPGTDDMPLGQRLLAETRGAKLVRPARRVSAGYRFSSGALRPGSIVEVSLAGSSPADLADFSATLASLEAEALSVTSVDSLFDPNDVAEATKGDEASATAPISTAAKPTSIADHAPRS